MHPDRCSNWKQRGQPEFVGPPGGPTSTVAISHFNPQLSLPEFVSAPGGPPSNVAISYVNPGGQAAFMEKVGDDDFRNDLVLKMDLERVQTSTVEIEKRKMLEEEINEMQSSDLELWEVDEYIYNANEFELEKENQHQPLVEDEAQEQNESQGEDNDENVTEAIVHEEEISLKPHVGMVFDSLDEACEFYNRYAYQKGFSVRKAATRKSEKDGSVIGRRLYCSKEGFREEKFKKNEGDKKKHRGETRCGCKARLLVNKSEDGSWVVSMFVEEHNHMLATPRKCHLLPSHRKIGESHGGMIHKMRQSGIRTNLMMNYLSQESQGSRNVGFIELDARNYMRTRRKMEFSVGDSQRLLDYLNEMQTKNPHFSYAIQLDVDGKLTSIFWSDARCRMDYSYFGDVVCFDPTYGTNKYGMPFVPIVGVNHHLQTILFGCALILDETEHSFVWVLENWLQAMKGSHPTVILTDQDSAITGAIAQVLPRTIHRFCLWHIFQNAKKHLGGLFKRGSKFGQDLSYCVRSPENIEDFEKKWIELLAKYDLKENVWMLRMYRKRHQWVHTYSRDFFCADMSTTQRSESINKFFKGFLNRKMLLLDFVQGVDKALIRRREKEIEADFKMNNVWPSLMLHMPIEEEASKLYTPAMFAKFQGELLASLRYKCEKIEENEGIASYKCWVPEREFRLVKLSFGSRFLVNCTCRKFEFTGLLCCHILKVFIVANVDTIPREYKLKRWTRDAKCGEVLDEKGQKIEEDCHTHLTLRYSTLAHEASKVATKGSCSVEVYKVALHWLRKAREEVEKAIKMQNIEVPNSNNDECLSQQTTMPTQVTIRDPSLAKCKGSGGRKKAFWEKNQKKRKPTSTIGNTSKNSLDQASKGLMAESPHFVQDANPKFP